MTDAMVLVQVIGKAARAARDGEESRVVELGNCNTLHVRHRRYWVQRRSTEGCSLHGISDDTVLVMIFKQNFARLQQLNIGNRATIAIIDCRPARFDSLTVKFVRYLPMGTVCTAVKRNTEQ